jgi:hypothetical protein
MTPADARPMPRKRLSTKRRFGLLASVLVLVCVGGCGRSGPQPAQPDAAGPPPDASGPQVRHWLIEEYAAVELSQTPAGMDFVRALNNPSTYEILTRHTGPDLLPKATHVDDFDSYAAIQAAFTGHAIPSDVKAILYDNERWPGTPVGEQLQPFAYVRKAEALVHEHGLAFISTPAPDLNSTLNPGHHGNYSGYLQERLAALAGYADIFDIQAQHAGSVASYIAFAKAAVIQARAANSRAIILLGITTNGETSEDLISEVTATRAIADGYWFNVIGGNPGVKTAVPVIQALGYGLSRNAQGLTRSPSKATATMTSARSPERPAPRGRYHSTTELIIPYSSRATRAGSTSCRRSPSSLACVTRLATAVSNSRRRAIARRSALVFPRTRSSSVTKGSSATSRSTLRRVSSSSRAMAGASSPEISSSTANSPSSARSVASRSNSSLPATWW